MHVVVSGNVYHRAVAFRAPQADLVLDTVTAELVVDGTTVAQAGVGEPSRYRGHHGPTAEAVDQRLHRRDRVIGGSLLHIPLNPAQRVTAKLVELGEVSLHTGPEHG